uniref:DENN domain containing 1B n=1 Tax=Pavo cristatus TaxID=9049 RepID=A0A8C9EZI2_PAVCR
MVLRFCRNSFSATDDMLTISLTRQHFTFVLTDIESKQRFGFCRLTSGGKVCLCILSVLMFLLATLVAILLTSYLFKQRNLTEYFVAVDVNNMLQLYASMLHERRIIITSSKLSTLTACVHASAALLYPMYWQHIYIPVLPPHLLDYCW